MADHEENKKILQSLISIKKTNERERKYENAITDLAKKHSSLKDIAFFTDIMHNNNTYAFEAFFCLATIFRRNRDFTKLSDLLQYAEKRADFKGHVSLPHIRIMYETHSESLYDYDTLLETAHKSACDLSDNSGYQHTFANAFATICENCLPEDLDIIIDSWYDSALYCVNKAISLQEYAKYYCTKARIVALKKHFDEANELILKAIDLEDSSSSDYPLLIGNYQYYRILLTVKKQQWLMESQIRNEIPTPVKSISSFQEMKPYAFISYARKDHEKVYSIIDDLVKGGLNIWYDQELKTGNEWDEEVGKKIISCELFVVFISNNSVLSRNVRNEINMAQNHDKKILPVVIEDVALSPGAELQLKRYELCPEYSMSKTIFLQKMFNDLALVRINGDKKEKTQATENESQKKQDKNKSGVTIIEKLCSSKYGTSNLDKKDIKCEDELVITNDFIAVIDGATSKTTGLFEGKTGGKIAAERIAKYIIDGNLDPLIDYKTAVNYIQSDLQSYSRENCFEEKGIHLCVSAVIYSVSKKQIWTIGDCQFLLNGKLFNYTKKVDIIMSDVRSMIIHTLLLSGKTEKTLIKQDEARSLILDILKMQQYLENTDDEYGYSVFSSNGDVKKVHVTNVSPGSEIVLASDGYPELYGTLHESEKRLNELIKKDPLCFKISKSTKGLAKGNTHFDDRTYVRFRVK